MIGVFGGIAAGTEASVPLDGMKTRLSPRVASKIYEIPGAAIGHAYHPAGNGGGNCESADGRYSLVFSGEVFKNGSSGDIAEDLLGTLIADDLNAMSDINGQFCAAMFDRETRRITFLTDRLCTFPIHIWRGPDRLMFASHIFTLLGDPDLPRKADSSALAQLFTMQRTIGRVTPFQAVTALPAASRIVFGDDYYDEQCYWHLRWQAPGFGRREGPHLLAAAMRDAVTRQLAGDDVGLMFSGGLDSRLILAAAPSGSLPCWTTASYADNPELRIAREIAETLGAAHHSVVVPPESTFDYTDAATIASDGMYPSSNGYYALAERAVDGCAIALTGHGLDYTLRGYYLPAKFLSVAGSKTRYPGLKKIPLRPTGADVLENLRQGPPLTTIERIVKRNYADAWWNGQIEAMEGVLSPWLQSDDPYNAWDAFLLHAVSKHYAFTGMQAIREFMDLRMPAFDNNVLEVYLQMPPAWRCLGRMTQESLVELNPEIAKVPNANTHFRADLHPRAEFACLLGRGVLRRLGIAKRTALPSAAHSEGSWQNLGALYQHAPYFRNRLMVVRGRLDALSFDCLDPDGLAACIDEHLSGEKHHVKLLRQLLTHDAWARAYEAI